MSIEIRQRCLLELHRTIEFLKEDKTLEAMIHFDLFSKGAKMNVHLQFEEGKIYKRIWKDVDQPTFDSHPDIAHHDFGRMAFHGLEGRQVTNETKVRALESFFVHVIKRELKKIAISFRRENQREAFEIFEDLFKISNEIPNLKKVQNLVYYKAWERMSRPPYGHLSEIAHLDFGRLGFHNDEQPTSTSLEKAESLEAAIGELDYQKFSKDLLKKANNYYKRYSHLLKPVDTADLHQQPSEPVKILEELLKRFQGICFGDVHADVFTIDFLYKNMNLFQEKGVKTLFMELFFTETQFTLDHFFRTGEISNALGKRCWDVDYRIQKHPYNTFTILEEARKRGIRIVGIDTELAGLDKNWKDGSRLEEMNYVAAKIIRREKGKDKFIVWLGRGHLSNSQVVESIMFPPRKRMIEILHQIAPDLKGLEEDIIECTFGKATKKIFKEEDYRIHRYQFFSIKALYIQYQSIIDAFISQLYTESIVSKKAILVPGVSELVQCPSIAMISRKNMPFYTKTAKSHSDEVCFNEQKTFRKLCYQKPNFEFIEKLKVGI